MTTTSTTDVDQLFTPLALYQGKLVAVKRVTKRAAVQLTKSRLIELKQVRGADVMHWVTATMATYMYMCAGVTQNAKSVSSTFTWHVVHVQLKR